MGTVEERESSPGPVAVLKFGGEVVAETFGLLAVLREVAQLTAAGWRFVLCHGGGPQANKLQGQLGLSPVMVGGRRVTDAATLRVMKLVLAGEVGTDVVAAALSAGISAVGISGVSASLVEACRRPPKVVSGGGPDPVDFGYVGDVVQIHPELVEHLWRGGFVPVLNTLGVAPAGPASADPCQVFNINADTVASAIAATLGADHLFLMTGVPGVLRDKDDPSTRIPRLDADAARQAISDGVIVGGMIPKVEEALENIERGIKAVHILGSEPGALAGEAASPGARGTVLTRA